MSDVSDLLQRSAEAHGQYRSHCAAMVPAAGNVLVMSAGNPEQAGIWLHEALRLRTEAHCLDPQRVDRAWGAEHLHDPLLDFYVEQLTR